MTAPHDPRPERMEAVFEARCVPRAGSLAWLFSCCPFCASTGRVEAVLDLGGRMHFRCATCRDTRSWKDLEPLLDDAERQDRA